MGSMTTSSWRSKRGFGKFAPLYNPESNALLTNCTSYWTDDSIASIFSVFKFAIYDTESLSSKRLKCQSYEQFLTDCLKSQPCILSSPSHGIISSLSNSLISLQKVVHIYIAKSHWGACFPSVSFPILKNLLECFLHISINFHILPDEDIPCVFLSSMQQSIAAADMFDFMAQEQKIKHQEINTSSSPMQKPLAAVIFTPFAIDGSSLENISSGNFDYDRVMAQPDSPLLCACDITSRVSVVSASAIPKYIPIKNRSAASVKLLLRAVLRSLHLSNSCEFGPCLMNSIILNENDIQSVRTVSSDECVEQYPSDLPFKQLGSSSLCPFELCAPCLRKLQRISSFDPMDRLCVLAKALQATEAQHIRSPNIKKKNMNIHPSRQSDGIGSIDVSPPSSIFPSETLILLPKRLSLLSCTPYTPSLSISHNNWAVSSYSSQPLKPVIPRFIPPVLSPLLEVTPEDAASLLENSKIPLFPRAYPYPLWYAELQTTQARHLISTASNSLKSSRKSSGNQTKSRTLPGEELTAPEILLASKNAKGIYQKGVKLDRSTADQMHIKGSVFCNPEVFESINYGRDQKAAFSQSVLHTRGIHAPNSSQSTLPRSSNIIGDVRFAPTENNNKFQRARGLKVNSNGFEGSQQPVPPSVRRAGMNWTWTAIEKNETGVISSNPVIQNSSNSGLLNAYPPRYFLENNFDLPYIQKPSWITPASPEEILRDWRSPEYDDIY